MKQRNQLIVGSVSLAVICCLFFLLPSAKSGNTAHPDTTASCKSNAPKCSIKKINLDIVHETMLRQFF